MGVRSSPSHLVFKFASATQHLLDLIPEIDKKQLSEKHRGRLRARVEELSSGLWPNESDEETLNLKKLAISCDKPPVSEIRWESEAKRAATLASEAVPSIPQVESKASSALKAAKAKIQKLEAEVAKMQTEPSLASVPVNHFRLTKNDDDKDYSYEVLFADYARGSTSVVISEPYVERPHQVTNVDAFIRCVNSSEPRLTSITLITLPGKTEAVESYLAQVIRTWDAKGVIVHVQHDQDAHARYIHFSTGLRVRGDRCLDIYRRPLKKGVPRLCLPTEIFIERVRTTYGSFRAPRADSEKPRSVSSKRDQGRKQGKVKDKERSPVKNPLRGEIRGADPSPLEIWRERKVVVVQSIDVDENTKKQDLERERACMMAEHAAALAREEYEYFHDGNGMTNEQIRQEAQNLAVWDLQGQHFFGDRFDARRVANMCTDGTVHYQGIAEGNEFTITPADPYVFRVSDGYHELFINHYYDGADYVSDEQMGEASAADASDSSVESGVPSSSEESMNSSSDRE